MCQYFDYNQVPFIRSLFKLLFLQLKYKRMQENQDNLAAHARYMRKKFKQGGVNEEEDQQEKLFKEDFEKAINTYGKKQATRDVEKQIEYFGYKIQPFNMREEEQMGQIDQDGFFVFNHRKRVRDAWMDSFEQNAGQGSVDTLRKKIKEQQREKNVYQAENNIEENENQDDQNQHQSKQSKQKQPQVQQDKLNVNEIKLFLSELLPFGTSANQYMKKLKKQKNTELYDKILLLCNEYIAITGEHDILTLKKQDLQEQQEQEEQKPIANWDKEQSQQQVPESKNGNDQKQPENEDDIFG